MDSPLLSSPGLDELLPLATTQKHELEIFLIHCVIVAGKNAPFGNAKTKALLKNSGGKSPFEYIKSLILRNQLDHVLRTNKVGNYTKMNCCFTAIQETGLDLETCTVEQLEAIPYVGLKTSRYFLMYTRPEEETNDLAVIDTHALKWCRKDPWAKKRLKELGVTNIPDSTPARTAKKLYLKIQQVICEDAKRKGISARKWDSDNWDEESKFSDLSRARAMAAVA